MRISFPGQADGAKVVIPVIPVVGVFLVLVVLFAAQLVFPVKAGPSKPEASARSEASDLPSRVNEPADFPLLVTLHLCVKADAEGNPLGVAVNGRAVDDLQALKTEVRRIVGRQDNPSDRREPEVVLDCDPALPYDQTLRVLTAVSEALAADGPPRPVDRVRFVSKKNQ